MHNCFSSLSPTKSTSKRPSPQDSRQLINIIILDLVIIPATLKTLSTHTLDFDVPAELVLQTAGLNALEVVEKLEAYGTGLVGGQVGESFVFGFHRNGFDGDESCGCAGGKDFVEGGEFGVIDLEASVSMDKCLRGGG